MTAWVPDTVVSESPSPETATDEALLVLQTTVAAAGSVPVVGVTVREPVTSAAGATVTVAVAVAGPSGPWATIV